MQVAAISSFVAFASGLPAQHQEILPSCLPEVAQPLLQYRLRGEVYDWGGGGDGSGGVVLEGNRLSHILTTDSDKLLAFVCAGEGGTSRRSGGWHIPTPEVVVRAGSTLYGCAPPGGGGSSSSTSAGGPILILPPGVDDSIREKWAAAFASALGTSSDGTGSVLCPEVWTVSSVRAKEGGSLCRLCLDR
mmetsp:Transcript_29224/g.86538  ORF Transcript_29224/g.86538 Transcript_29224/m.86538 type:complete len:189 (+) Transcript_29224:905-1471(+)